MIIIKDELSKLSAIDAAKRLIGCDLSHEVDGHLLIGRIVETEAYDQTDLASHSYRGLTQRNQVMFGPAGFAYVYFTYGMHYCMNVVVAQEGYGAAVLIRALEPIAGIKQMELNRATTTGSNIANGPAKLTQALAINKQSNGHDLSKAPLKLKLNDRLAEQQLVACERIGIKEGRLLLWRICLIDSRYLSKKTI